MTTTLSKSGSSPLAAGPGTGRRRASSVGFRVLTYVALVLIIAPAAWLLIGVLAKAWAHWRWDVLWTTLTPEGGGLRDQILGTLIIMVGVLIIAGTIGMLAGIYLSEIAQTRKSGKRSGGFLRTCSDILSGFPSIVLGYVGYTALVVGLHWGYSLLAALIIVSIMVIPYIAKTTETSLRQVPTGYREGAEALGMTMGYSLRKVVLKSAAPGIVTGLLLAMAIACGETAPLIYTAGLLQLAAALAHPRRVPLPHLRGLRVLRLVDHQLPLPGLRRRAHSGGDRAAAPGGQPARRGPHAAPCRGLAVPPAHAAAPPPARSGRRGARRRRRGRPDLRRRTGRVNTQWPALSSREHLSSWNVVPTSLDRSKVFRCSVASPCNRRTGPNR